MSDSHCIDVLEAALRESNAHYRSLVDHVPLGVSVVEVLEDDLSMVSINSVGAAHFGWQQREVEGHLLSELGLASDEMRTLLTRYKEAAKSAEPLRFEHEIRRTPQPARHFEVTLCRIDVPGVPRICAIAQDITDRKQKHARLLLSGHLDSVATLAAGIAHEVNNPLAYVMGNLTFVSEEISRRVARLDAAAQGAPPVATGPLMAETRDGLIEMGQAMDDALGGAERIRQTVKNLRIIAQSDEDLRGPVEIERVVELAIALTEHEITRRARLVRSFQAVPAVQGNEARLGQVVLHLLFNAAHAIRTDKPLENEIRVGIRPHPSGRVAVEISDSGEGIAPEHLDRVFDPYFTTKPMGIGMGLGLSICHGIIKALGGDIEADSRVGQGSTFRVLLPLCPASLDPS